MRSVFWDVTTKKVSEEPATFIFRVEKVVLQTSVHMY